MPKTQIIFIHGGNCFDTQEKYLQYLQNKEYNPFEIKSHWKNYLAAELGEWVTFFAPEMPCMRNAQYIAWKVWFKKLFPYLVNEPVILIGHSLGTVFLAKYLSEDWFPKMIQAIHLVWSVFDGEDIDDEDMADFILQPKLLASVEELTTNIHLYHSTDDESCPWKNVEKYQQYFPHAVLHKFTDRWHFRQSEFPELLEQIQKEISL